MPGVSALSLVLLLLLLLLRMRMLQVAFVLSLVVEHCPSASHDPRDLCSLLSVSTACRKAVQASSGHCCIALSGQVQQLRSVQAWLCAGNSSLVATLMLPSTSPLTGSSTMTHRKGPIGVMTRSVLVHAREAWEVAFVAVLSKLTNLQAQFIIKPRSACLVVCSSMPLLVWSLCMAML